MNKAKTPKYSPEVRERAVRMVPILTEYGIWSFSGPMDLHLVQEIVQRAECISAIGHEGTARYLSERLGVEIPVARKSITMSVGDEAIVFRLRGRLTEGVILDLEGLREIDTEFGWLKRLE